VPVFQRRGEAGTTNVRMHGGWREARLTCREKAMIREIRGGTEFGAKLDQVRAGGQTGLVGNERKWIDGVSAM